MSADNSLVIPPIAQRDPQSFEVLRVWVAEESQHVSIQSEVWEDPFAWGILLADLAHHIANAHKLHKRVFDTDAFLKSLVEGFHAEIENPTGNPTGEINK